MDIYALSYTDYLKHKYYLDKLRSKLWEKLVRETKQGGPLPARAQSKPYSPIRGAAVMYWKWACSASCAELPWSLSPSRSLSRASWGTLHPHPFRSAKRVRRKFTSRSWAWGSNGLLMATGFCCSTNPGSAIICNSQQGSYYFQAVLPCSCPNLTGCHTLTVGEKEPIQLSFALEIWQTSLPDKEATLRGPQLFPQPINIQLGRNHFPEAWKLLYPPK